MLVDVSILESENKRVLSSEIFESEENDAEERKMVLCEFHHVYKHGRKRICTISIFTIISMTIIIKDCPTWILR